MSVAQTGQELAERHVGTPPQLLGVGHFKAAPCRRDDGLDPTEHGEDPGQRRHVARQQLADLGDG